MNLQRRQESLSLLVIIILGFAHCSLALVNCSASPNCKSLRRQPCDVTGAVPNSCGDCLPGTFGGIGPSNAVCLSNVSCGVIYAGEDSCTYLPGSGQSTPFIIPLKRCVCDDGGVHWPTAPGRCARVVVKSPSNAGQFEVQQCTSRTCDPASCSPLATWDPVIYPQLVNTSAFPCRQQGFDSIEVTDDCTAIIGRQTLSALCGRLGMEPTSDVFSATGENMVDCTLAPRCPASVLESTRLAESCCEGTLWSRVVSRNGQETVTQAPGFCRILPSSTVGSPSPPCHVGTNGPGWKGCACLDSRGFPDVSRTCTLSCVAPLCPLPQGGVPPVRAAWVTSQVPASIFPVTSACSLHKLSFCATSLFLFTSVWQLCFSF